MLKLTYRYANALFEYAQEKGLEVIYRQALVSAVNHQSELEDFPQELREFLEGLPHEEIEPVLYRFLDLARSEMNLLPVEIITAVELRPEQLEKLEHRLILMFRKQLDITLTVDPSILGGLRVIAGDTVLDDTIKRKLSDMKAGVYRGVYFKQ